VSWLSSNDIPKRLGREEMLSGSGPVSLLWEKLIVKRVLICERVFGISPEMLVWLI
jgi:hypothetical protein